MGRPATDGDRSAHGIIAHVSGAATIRRSPAFPSPSIARLLERLRTGDVRALARAISLVEDSAPGAAELVGACREGLREAPALRIGITGPPGAGKSTLVDGMVKLLRAQGKKVGVLAIDPSSPYTGGALLGDRIRMQGFVGDDGIYIRSMASRGAVGGVAAKTADVCDVMGAARLDIILIETVGVGQDEVEVARLADVTVLVLVPGMGDEVQSLKAGVMEIAHVFVVNKADCEGAERMEAEILSMQALTADAGWVAPVVSTVATRGQGIEQLIGEVLRCASAGSRMAPRRDIARRPIPSTEVTFATLDKESSSGLRLDHVGIAVRSIAAARGVYESLGMAVGHEQIVEGEQVRAAMLVLGGARIELLEAASRDSVIGRFLAKRGEGLHHLAVHAPDVDALFTRLLAEGVRLASESVRIGAGGHRYFFIHPASTGGVLLEIVGDAGKPVEPHDGDGRL